MDKIEEELLKLSLSPDEVDNPELFLEKLYGVKTHEDVVEISAMIHRRSTSEPPTMDALESGSW